MITYGDYLIYENEFKNAKYPQFDYLYHNSTDCDEPQGSAVSILECINQINEKIKID
jgi:hypothetical protein